MKRYSVLVSTTASKEFRALDKEEQDRIREKLNDLSEDPHNSYNRLDTKKLSGTKYTYFRLRTGDYRVIYHTEEETIKVVRIAIGYDAYSWLD